MFNRQVARNERGIIGLDRGVLSVKATFGICEFRGVNTIAFLEATYIFTDGGDRSGSVSAEHVGEFGFHPHYFYKPAFAFIGIPRADAGSFDPD